MSLFVKENGVWAPVNSLSVHNAGAYVPVKNAFVKKDGAWSQYFTSEGGVYPTDEISYYEFEADHHDPGNYNSIRNLVDNQYDSTIYGTTTDFPDGKAGGCLKSSFGASEFLAKYPSVGLYTIVFWYYFDGGIAKGIDIFDNGSTLLEVTDTGATRFTALFDDSSSESKDYGIQTGWHFVAIQPADPDGRWESMIVMDESLDILGGSRLPDAIEAGWVAFSGALLVDQLRVYDRYLTQEEVAQLYNNGNGTPLP